MVFERIGELSGNMWKWTNHPQNISKYHGNIWKLKTRRSFSKIKDHVLNGFELVEKRALGDPMRRELAVVQYLLASTQLFIQNLFRSG